MKNKWKLFECNSCYVKAFLNEFVSHLILPTSFNQCDFLSECLMMYENEQEMHAPFYVQCMQIGVHHNIMSSLSVVLH